MSSIAIQANIKNNSQELVECLKDLKRWEKEIKAEDKELGENKNDGNCSLKFQGSSENKEFPMNIDMSDQQKAEKLKEEGNKYYLQGKFKQAAEKYEEGIKLTPQNAILFANRAMVYLKLEKYEKAVSDCEKCLKLDSKYVKAYLRRATAWSKLFKYSAAIEDYNKVLEIEPWNKEVKQELEKLKNEQKKSTSTANSKVAKSTLDIVSSEIDAENAFGVNDCNINLSNNDNSADADLNNTPIVELKCSSKSVVTSSSRTTRGKIINIKDVSPVRISKHSKLQEPPPPPRTSHQFYLDWKKVVNYESVAEAYLLSFPGSFFHGVELDVDQLIEVIHLLNCGNLEPHDIVDLLQSLMLSRGFYLNLAFLEPDQKREFDSVIKKIEDNGFVNENIQKIKKALLL